MFHIILIENKWSNSVEKGRLFLEWALSYLFDKTDYEIEGNDLQDGILICDGAYDCGIYVAYIILVLKTNVLGTILQYLIF